MHADGPTRCTRVTPIHPPHRPQELQEALNRARQETEDAIQTHNKKYNDMLAERLRAEDSLSEQLSALRKQLEALGRSKEDLEGQFGDARTRWDQERVKLHEDHKVRSVIR